MATREDLELKALERISEAQARQAAAAERHAVAAEKQTDLKARQAAAAERHAVAAEKQAAAVETVASALQSVIKTILTQSLLNKVNPFGKKEGG